MNDRTHDLQHRLQRATASECPPPPSMDAASMDAASMDAASMDAASMDAASMDAASMDAETASLREGWLAFGQLLESAQTMADASEFERLLPRPQPIPNETARTKRSSRWTVSLAAALAVSLLLGATLAWNFLSKRTGLPLRPTPEVAVDDTHTEIPPSAPILESPDSAIAEDPMAIAADAAAEDAAAEDAVDALQWDDPLDDQLALVSREITRIEGDWDRLDDGFRPVWEGIDRIEQEIDEDTL